MADAGPSPDQILQRVRTELQTQMMQGTLDPDEFYMSKSLFLIVLVLSNRWKVANFCPSLLSSKTTDLMNKITDNCFQVFSDELVAFFLLLCYRILSEYLLSIIRLVLQVCTGKRGDGLDSSEKNCLHNCINRYMDTMAVVNKTLVSRQGSD